MLAECRRGHHLPERRPLRPGIRRRRGRAVPRGRPSRVHGERHRPGARGCEDPCDRVLDAEGRLLDDARRRRARALEDAFAAREREREIAETGKKAWYAEAREKASDVVARLERPAGQRFSRTSILGTGYHPKDVDAFAERLSGYFREGKALSLTEVRSVVFRPKHGGYREAQVDALLDAVVEVMLAVR